MCNFSKTIKRKNDHHCFSVLKDSDLFFVVSTSSLSQEFSNSVGQSAPQSIKQCTFHSYRYLRTVIFEEILRYFFESLGRSKMGIIK